MLRVEQLRRSGGERNVKTPPHFQYRPITFKIYVLECAIRDREAFLDAIRNASDHDKVREDTKAELKVMRIESNRLRRELTRRRQQET